MQGDGTRTRERLLSRARPDAHARALLLLL
jgi:hypothetical protein